LGFSALPPKSVIFGANIFIFVGFNFPINDVKKLSGIVFKVKCSAKFLLLFVIATQYVLLFVFVFCSVLSVSGSAKYHRRIAVFFLRA